MSSAIKENEVLTAIPETASSRPVASSTAAPAGDPASRPQPVAMEVPVTVNGARAVNGSEKREPFSESTKTVLIFGHGAVVRLSSSVAPGQLLFLTNEKTKKEVVCQVVKSKKYQSASGYVELEFTEAVAGFWGMRFSAEAGPSQTLKPVLPTPSALPPALSGPAVEIGNETKGYSSNPGTSVPAPSQNVPALQNSVVELLPSATRSPMSAPVANVSKAKVVTPPAMLPAVKSSATQTKSILDDEEVKIPSWLEPLARNAAIASAASATPAEPETNEVADIEVCVPEVKDLSLTEVADTPEVARPQLPPPTFGTHFLADGDALGAETAHKSSKKVLFGAIAAGVLLAVGAGAWYMQQQQNSSESTNTPVVVSAPVSNATSNSSPQPPSQTSSTSANSNEAAGTYTATSAPASAGISPAVLSNKPSEPSSGSTNLNKRMATVDAVSSPVAAQPKKASLGPISLSAPVLNRPANSQVRAEEGLNLEASSQPGLGEGLAAGLGSSSRQPAAPASPLPVGGDVKSARLISSTPPVYPTLARAQRISGDVKIDALVEATGAVSSMKVVSGPPLLQQAAMDALRHWRYQPAQLDGRAVPMHLTVTVQFKLQ